MADTFNYRIDHHGSLVRPAALLSARERHARGDIDTDALDEATRAAVEEAVTFQRRLRTTVVTDGDFPRADFRGVVLDAVSGFRRIGDESSAAESTGPTRWAAESRPKTTGPLLGDWPERIASLTVIAPKVSLPSAAYLAATCFDPALTASGGPASARELGEALAEILRGEIQSLISRGVKLIQLDNPLLLAEVDGAEPALRGALSFADALAVEASTVAAITRPEGVRIGLCPGWAAPAAVDRNRVERLYEAIAVERWVLPFDQGTSAELDLVEALPKDRDVCLGVVDPTVAAIEDIDTVMARIDAAAEHKDIEDMALSPSRGFADVADQPLLSTEEQRRKLVLVETLARYCWGNEF